ncbi:MAG: isochorismatase family protein [Actinomycetota bacterium]
MVEYASGTALVVVDVQNDFAHPKGSLYVRGGDLVVPVVNREIERALEAGASVVYTQDWHPERTPHFKQDGGIWPVHCVAETWGADFHPDLRVETGAPTVRKGADGRDGYSAFSVRDPESGDVEATRLENLLLSKNLDRVVIAGLATDYCVVETALDSRRLGHPTAVVREAIRAVELNVGDGAKALERAAEAGATIE